MLGGGLLGVGHWVVSERSEMRFSKIILCRHTVEVDVETEGLSPGDRSASGTEIEELQEKRGARKGGWRDIPEESHTERRRFPDPQ